MSENSKTNSNKSLGSRMRDWFNGGDPDGRAKIRTWATGEDGRWRGYTHSMSKYVTWLMVIACILYPLTRGIGSILALVVAIFLMGGRAMIERQVRRDVSDLEEAKKQYGLTRNPEYLQFMTLRAEGLLEDNKILTPDSRTLLEGYAQWARERQEREDRKQAKKARRAEKKARRDGTARQVEGDLDGDFEEDTVPEAGEKSDESADASDNGRGE
ncbi:hypothetical protein [Actinomyces sp. ZJ308]|uniref:hypothetical protein n=1 Tax=Actinomyces sp. ZJ308 TaxID=2708342 RepID=UPI0014246B8C|nr:hypothetical protein [Actinomyces sp. ZJ308]